MCADKTTAQVDQGQTDQLRVTEIFFSLQGESSTVGYPTIFIRLTGCPLRCVYCDTTYAFQGGEWLSIDEILEKVSKLLGSQKSTRHVTVTGGEPLAQKNCQVLLSKLCDAGYSVSLETSGALDISKVDRRVVKVMDLKTPSSGEQAKNRLGNLNVLSDQDEVKFVISDRADYDWAKDTVKENKLDKICEVLFSPVYGQIEPGKLADWILEDKLPVRFQLQLHKILWGEEQGR